MDRTVTATCAKCQRLEVRVDALQSDIASLPKLRVAARKDSTTSSKSPSSDIVKPKPAPDTDGTSRSIGDGMHGYPMHHREPFPVDRGHAFRVAHAERHSRDDSLPMQRHRMLGRGWVAY
jgi:hypothetical protein